MSSQSELDHLPVRRKEPLRTTPVGEDVYVAPLPTRGITPHLPAFSSPTFRKLVNQGFLRAQNIRAESSFEIKTDGKLLYFSPLEDGTSVSDGAQDDVLGMSREGAWTPHFVG